ncbi:MAG: hypothetical protein IKK88_03420 [Oscillospiraceae bacterium]|nr:hypothetical protein [Oscillospiraceae bacterium]
MKYKCPYCEKNTFTLIQKIFTGGMTSKGRACPECGKHAVHGMKANIFRSVMNLIPLIFFMVNYFKQYVSFAVCLAIFIGVNIFCMIINGLFFDLDYNNRKDL